jgi:hypothetical protein
MTYPCPVCGYRGLEEPPIQSHEICPSCGTEFGYTDFARSIDDLRAEWLRSGPRWHASWMAPPANWDGKRQLLSYVVPSTRDYSGQLRMFASDDTTPVIQGVVTGLMVADQNAA